MKFDFIQALHQLVEKKKTICLITFVFGIIGIFAALNKPKEFTANVVLAPELTNANRMSESLGSLTAMLGVDINGMNGSNVDAIFPEIYPKVVSSPDFVIDLWNIPVTLSDGTTKSYYDHITQDVFVPVWMRPVNWLTSLFASQDSVETIAIHGELPDPRFFDKQQESIHYLIQRNISCSVAADNGLITITARDLDPNVACAIADTVQKKLQQYITNYRTQKARNDYEYSLKLVNEAREEYLDAQRAAANFADANISVFKQKVIIERDILQNEFQIKYNTYNALSSQLQNVKALIQASTPVYTTIKNAAVPNYASSTSRTLIVILYTIFGFISAMVWVLFAHDYLKEMIAQYKAIK